MKASINYQESIKDISTLITKMHDAPAKEERAALRRIGDAVKHNVEVTVRRSNKVYTKPGYGHIADDVTYVIRKSKADRNLYVSISGGKNTGWKWHFVNNGHVATNGRYVAGSRFADIATVKSEAEISKIVDDMCNKIVGG